MEPLKKGILLDVLFLSQAVKLDPNLGKIHQLFHDLKNEKDFKALLNYYWYSKGINPKPRSQEMYEETTHLEASGVLGTWGMGYGDVYDKVDVYQEIAKASIDYRNEKFFDPQYDQAIKSPEMGELVKIFGKEIVIENTH